MSFTIEKLENVKGNNGQYTALCPAHDDNNNSLSVKITNDRILLYCHAGCSTEAIMSSLGLPMTALFMDEKPKKSSAAKHKINTITYDYKTADGSIAYRKQRYEFDDNSKSFAFYTPDGKKGRGGKSYPYNLTAVLAPEAETVYFCEGEKCVDAVTKAGRIATSLDAGANSIWKKEYNAYFENKNVIILPDNDEPGALYASKIAHELTNSKIIRLPDLPKGGDIYDWLQHGHTMEEIDELPPFVKPKPPESEISIDDKDLYLKPYVYQDSNNGKYKLSEPIFVDYFRKNIKFFFVCNKEFSDQQMFLYENGVYNLCSPNRAKSVMENMLPLELRTTKNINPLWDGINRVDTFVKYEDCNPENYINFKNGLYDIHTGKIQPHTSDIFTTIQIPVKYNPDADYSKYIGGAFDTFINHHLGSDKSQIQLILEFFGLILSNIPAYRYKKALVSVGEGDTGKSQLPKLLRKIIGDENFCSFKLDKLENSRFEVANLYNKRLGGDPDMSFMRVRELSLFKNLTGGDPISAEFKSRNGFDFIFNGLLWFCANDLPQFGGDKGEHVYNRFCIVRSIGKTHKKGEQSIDSSVEADPLLLDKMFKESPYIINKALSALKTLIENERFSETDKQKQELSEYKKTNSSIAEFFDECIVPRQGDTLQDSVTRARINKTYGLWCKENRKYLESKTDLFNYILQNGGIEGTKDGKIYYKNFTLSAEIKQEFHMFDGTENL